jgi:hypothetical protein
MTKKKRASRKRRPITDAERAILAKGAPVLLKMLALIKKLEACDFARDPIG